MPLSPDSHVILLLCSHLALPSGSDIAPLTLREWHPLARQLQSASAQPGDLLGLEAADLQRMLSLNLDESTRLARLLDRSEALGFAIRRLDSLGITVLTRFDNDYPQRYLERLKDSAPLVLYCAGETALLGQQGIAIVGSRRLDETGEDCAAFVGNACGMSGLVVYSGGARGVDTISMNAALEARGTAVGILPDSLEKAIRVPEARAALSRGDLCLASPYSPSAGFSVGAAMGRNKLIYTLADYALVVASEAKSGGTWAGASEALKNKWLPVFILKHPAMPEGNRLLLQSGGLPFPHPFPENYLKLPDWLHDQANQVKPKPTQPGFL